MRQPLTLATEGFDDEAVARKICAVLGITVAQSYPARGKSKLDPKIMAYNKAAVFAPWLVLRDLDGDAPCPGELCRHLLEHPADQMMSLLAAMDAIPGGDTPFEPSR